MIIKTLKKNILILPLNFKFKKSDERITADCIEEGRKHFNAAFKFSKKKNSKKKKELF